MDRSLYPAKLYPIVIYVKLGGAHVVVLARKATGVRVKDRIRQVENLIEETLPDVEILGSLTEAKLTRLNTKLDLLSSVTEELLLAKEPVVKKKPRKGAKSQRFKAKPNAKNSTSKD